MTPMIGPTLISLATAAAALLSVVGLVLLVGRLARTRLAGLALMRTANGGRRLKLAETLALDPRRRLHLIECDGKLVLMLTGGSTDLMVPLSVDRP